MAKITKIKAQKNKKRVNIYLDDEFAFGLDADNFLKVGLKVGQELTDKEIEGLIFKNEFQKLLDKVLRFISFRPRSEKEIRDYLKRKLPKKQATANLVGKILGRLEKLGVLDDEEFTRWWIEQRSTFRPRGKMALKVELTQKGIKRDLAEKIIDQMVDELSLTQKAAQKNIKTYERLDNQEFREKMTSFLFRRGFSWVTIKKVIDEMVRKR